ncbi:MAG: hypothetical protein JOY96_06060 [Verrucomicrobia bacterium]|nr:hypothetical protein [Verrucomicrobiota bacterium]
MKSRTHISAASRLLLFLFVLPLPAAAQPKNDKKGLALEEFAKPFAIIPFDHVRAQAHERQEASFAAVSQNGTSMNAGVGNFSFSHYLAPPSSSFGALMEDIRAELVTRDVQRTYAAESSQFDHLLEVTRYVPIQFGMGSVRRDALDDYDDRLLEKPIFVRPNP